MKRFLIFAALLIAFLIGSPVSAQTSITTTTLSGAMTTLATRQTIVVSSATGMAVGSTVLYIDGSVYQINAISGTTITITNTFRPTTHLTSATVYVVPIAAQMSVNPVGSCIRGGGTFPAYSPYTLMFNLTTGDIAACAGLINARKWVITNPYAVQYSTTPSQSPS